MNCFKYLRMAVYRCFISNIFLICRFILREVQLKVDSGRLGHVISHSKFIQLCVIYHEIDAAHKRISIIKVFRNDISDIRE